MSGAPAPVVSPSISGATTNVAGLDPKVQQVHRIAESLGQLAEDASVPRNVRRGAQSAREELGKPKVALDLRIAAAVNVLDDLANDPNLPTHGRTAIWSIISHLESVQ
ncbi:MAG TPA: UPF0147 family protein [Thermoplasmata archaeon]|nr:UPF0147 family protein [Thermoplasmata archaeon]